VPVLGEHPDQRAADRRVVFNQQELNHGSDDSHFADRRADLCGFAYRPLYLPLAKWG